MSKKIKIVNDKGIVIVSTFCPTCTRYINASDSGLFCKICELSIHTPCSDLQQYEKFLEISHNFSNDNKTFSFQLICNPCLKGKITRKTCPMVGSSYDQGDCFKGRHIFSNDIVVEAILNHLSIRDQINLRLLNTVFNRNAVKILSNPSNQSKLKPMDIRSKMEKFVQVIQNSQNIKLFRTFWIKWLSFCKISEERDCLIDLVKFVKPLEIRLEHNGRDDQNHFWYFIQDLLPEMCQDVEKLILIKKSYKIQDEPTNWPEGLRFPKLKSLHDNSIVPQGLFQVLTRNSENLKELRMIFVKDFQMLVNVESVEDLNLIFLRANKIMQMSEELLKVQGLKLKKFKTYLLPCKGYLVRNFSNIEYSNEFSRFQTFLETQSQTLEFLELKIYVEQFHQINSEEERDTFRLNFPKMEKLKRLSILHYVENVFPEFKPHSEVWPINPVNLPEIFPQLTSIKMNFVKDWTQNFDSAFPCDTVREFIIEGWSGQSLREIVKIFPKIETCRFRADCKYENILSLYGWSKTLKTIEISFDEDEEFQNFSFKKFAHFTNLTEMKIIGVNNYCAKIQDEEDPPTPDFSPLGNIENLKKISIKGFKNSEDLIAILAQQCPNLPNS